MTTTVFISYAREDSEPATAIAEGLRRQGFVVYRDQDFLRAGRFGEQLDTAIAGSNVFLLLISRSSVRSTYVARELHVAADEHLLPVLPVMLDDADVTPFRLTIAGLQQIDFSGRPRNSPIWSTASIAAPHLVGRKDRPPNAARSRCSELCCPPSA